MWKPDDDCDRWSGKPDRSKVSDMRAKPLSQSFSLCAAAMLTLVVSAGIIASFTIYMRSARWYWGYAIPPIAVAAELSSTRAGIMCLHSGSPEFLDRTLHILSPSGLGMWLTDDSKVFEVFCEKESDQATKIRLAGTVMGFQVPLWFLSVFPALLAFLIMRRHHLRLRRTSALSCQHCGYDLRGQVSDYCPECGALFRGSRSTDSERGCSQVSCHARLKEDGRAPPSCLSVDETPEPHGRGPQV